LEAALVTSPQYRKAVFWMAKVFHYESQLRLVDNDHHARIKASTAASKYYGRALELHPAYYETIFPSE
jgi:hypothetical protein